jgi:hypothetical protein
VGSPKYAFSFNWTLRDADGEVGLRAAQRDAPANGGSARCVRGLGSSALAG